MIHPIRAPTDNRAGGRLESLAAARSREPRSSAHRLVGPISLTAMPEGALARSRQVGPQRLWHESRLPILAGARRESQQRRIRDQALFGKFVERRVERTHRLDDDGVSDSVSLRARTNAIAPLMTKIKLMRMTNAGFGPMALPPTMLSACKLIVSPGTIFQIRVFPSTRSALCWPTDPGAFSHHSNEGENIPPTSSPDRFTSTL